MGGVSSGIISALSGGDGISTGEFHGASGYGGEGEQSCGVHVASGYRGRGSSGEEEQSCGVASWNMNSCP
jgi:hypothetical protein